MRPSILVRKSLFMIPLADRFFSTDRSPCGGAHNAILDRRNCSSRGSFFLFRGLFLFLLRLLVSRPLSFACDILLRSVFSCSRDYFTYEGRKKRKLRVLILIFSEGNRMDFLIGIDFFQSFGCFNQNFIRKL